MKTSRRNMAAAIAFFVIADLLAIPASYWLAVSFDLKDWAIGLIALFYGVMVGVISFHLYRELQELAWRRREKADEARLQARWEELRRGLL